MTTVEVPQTLEYRGGQLNAAPVLEVENFTNWKKRFMCHIIDSLDNEKDTRSSYEYLNDLEEEYQARALLAKSIRFFKKAKYNKVKFKLALLSSSSSASKASMVKNKGLIAEAYEWDEEEVSSDDNEMVQVKVLMALAEENDVVSKEGAKNDEWVKISMRKDTLFLKWKIMMIEKNLVHELNACKEQLLVLKPAKLDFLTMQHVNTKILKENKNLRTELKELKVITETWLNSSNKVNQCISEQISSQKKRILGLDQLTKDPSSSGLKDLVFVKSSVDDTKITILGVERPWLSEAEGLIMSNHDTGRILPYELQRNTTDSLVAITDSIATDYDSADESSVCSIPLPPLKQLDGAEPIYGLKTFKSILRSKSTFKVEALKDVTINEPSSAPAKGNKSSSASKVHSAPAVDNINIAESERYPPDEYLHPYEPSQRNQTNNNDVSFIEPYECPEPMVFETEVSSDPNDQIDQNDQPVQNNKILNDDHSEHPNHSNDEQIIDTPQDRWSQDKNIKLVNIIGNPGAGMLIRAMAKQLSVALAHECLFVDFLSKEERKKVSEALKHPEWVLRAMNYLTMFANWTKPCGLKKDPRAWYETLSTFLTEHKFVRRKIDKTLFVYKTQSDVILVQIYVDDIIFGSTSIKLCKQFAKLMTQRYEMSMMGVLTYFLGFQIKQSERGISINQEKYVKDLLKKYDINGSSVKTPMVPPNNLGPDLNGKFINETQYRGMIGSLMYLTTSKPDIQFLTCLCARYQANPKESYLIVVNRIFRYLKGTPSLGLWYPKCSGFDLKGYSDSDYQSVAMSSAEAKYVAVAGCCANILWMKSQLTDYDIIYEKTICNLDVHVDSKAPKYSSLTEEAPQGKNPGARSGLRRKQSSKQTYESTTEASKSQSGHLKKETKSNSTMDTSLSHPLPPTPVVGEMHKEAQQAAGGPTSLGDTNKDGAHPQLSSGSNPSVLVDKIKSAGDGLKTAHTTLSANKESRADDISQKVKLEDLANILKDTRSAFFTPDFPTDEPIIVSNVSEEEENAENDKDTEDTSVPPPSPKSAQLQKLMAQVHLLQSQKKELEQEKVIAEAEVASTKAKPSYLDINQLTDLLITSLKPELSKLLASHDFARKAQDIGFSSRSLKTVTNILKRFATLVENASEATTMGVPSADKATASLAEGEKDADTNLKNKLVDLLDIDIVTQYYNKKLLYERYCKKMKRRQSSNIINCDVLTKKGPILLKWIISSKPGLWLLGRDAKKPVLETKPVKPGFDQNRFFLLSFLYIYNAGEWDNLYVILQVCGSKLEDGVHVVNDWVNDVSNEG
uniref:Uncharacterized mitochondrial protein AtMg00810-like n=1 Tax=Tanacetum cinerariifolium TaxID=118510 RepID=A0A6L2JJ88_TANCI|nr:uncharacterized mitochondrial protein AtMg00810-like [Tanacetum cinerariifolium]